ncbi:MAG: hypothetical protein HUU50_14625 [Candidatus Brocadiae bacterium]|nr:hypothetical protein [Candidatus Brocadiia bacterium]
MELKILYEDENFIVADKEKDLPVHGGEGIDERKTLIFQIKEHLTLKNGKPPEFITPSHRLDSNTQGAIFLAKNRDSHAVLTHLFSSGGVWKTYLALLEGKLESATFVQADILKSHKKAIVKNICVMAEKFPSREAWLAQKDKNSQTISATLLFPIEIGEDTTLCKIETWTGRYHQIRAICEAIGHQICGDEKYNHDPRDHYRRKTNPKYQEGQMLICKTIDIPTLGIVVTSGFELVL